MPIRKLHAQLQFSQTGAVSTTMGHNGKICDYLLDSWFQVYTYHSLLAYIQES